MNNDTVAALRAIASVMTRQFLLPFIIGGAVVLLLLLGLIIFLAAHDTQWWLLLLVPLVPLLLIFCLGVLLLWFVFKKLTPAMSKQQRKAVKQFTRRVAAYSDLAGTSRFLIAFRIVRDVVRKRPRKYLGELLDSSSELKRDFEAVRATFSSS